MPTLKFYGHSAFRINDDKHTIFIDPFLTGNPVCPNPRSTVTACNYILVTHGHADHIGDALELAQEHSSTIIATWELAQWFASKGVKTHAMSTGGAHEFPFGKVKMTQAIHGVGADPRPNGVTPPPNTPVGFLIHWNNKKWYYHAGDTALFGDMKLIGERQKIDVAMLPIGDNFTMGPEDAGVAAEFLNAQLYIPMHFNTFDVIKVDPITFQYRVEKGGRKCKVLQPGDKLEI